MRLALADTVGYATPAEFGELVRIVRERTPDHVVVPIASGSLLTKIHKGYQELIKLGLAPETKYAIHGAQATGCSPIAVAQKAGLDFFKPVKPNTIAKSLAIGTPADGFYALRVMKETGGAAEDVTDEGWLQTLDEIAKDFKVKPEPKIVAREVAKSIEPKPGEKQDLVYRGCLVVLQAPAG